MLISMNWIKDFVDLTGLNTDELIYKFTLSTAEVEEICHKGEDVRGVVVGKVLSVEPHPESKKLHLLKVDAGDAVYDCVCGAPNVAVGIKVPFAKEGGMVKGIDIKKATVAGYTSFGMCCSEDELGISADRSGLMLLPQDATVGEDIKNLYDIDDTVFEVDNKSLTNRPDLWGHYGIAREFAAISGRELKPVEGINASHYKHLPPVAIEVEDDLCLRYSSVKVDNVSVKVSPVNMRIRLFYCGSRAINLLADLTNYLMLELGQPMHAFDRRKVDSIEVKRFGKPFMFSTLDGQSRAVDEDTLMICCGGEPVAIAGVMGGLDSEIVDDTSSLLIESATFNGVRVRKTSTRLGLRTDASMRYEKVLDPELTVLAIERYLKLLLDIDAGANVISRVSDIYRKGFDEITLSFDKKYVDRYAGIDISKEKIEKTLKSLGFGVHSLGNSFTVKVPSWRRTKDVTIKADIIEEITRIYGYDNFEIKTTLSPLAPVRDTPARKDTTLVKNLLADRFGLHEVHSYIWCDAKKYKEIGIEVEENVKLLNSMSPDNTVLRRSMVPTLLVMAAENKLVRPDFGMFEIGRVVDGLRPDGTCDEKKRLGVVLFSRERNEKQLFFALRDMIATLVMMAKNITCTFENASVTHSWQHPVNTASVLAQGSELGVIYTLHPAVKNAVDKKAAVVCAELDMDMLAAIEPVRLAYEEPSKYPGIDMDLTFIVNGSESFAVMSAVWEGCSSPLLKGVKLTDVYDDGSSKSVTVRFTYMLNDRTLSMDEVKPHTEAVVAAMAKAGYPLKG